MARRWTLNHRRLARELERSRLSQNAWARRLGISKAYLSQLLSGQRRHPGPSTRQRLLRATGLTFEDLFRRSPQRRSPPAPRTLVRLKSGPYQLRLERLVSRRAAKAEGDPMAVNLLRDLRLSFRSLICSPGYSLMTVVILALGIGANATIFSVVQHVLLTPMPFPEPDRIVRLWQSRLQDSGVSTSTVSPANYLDWKAESRSFSAMGAYTAASLVLTGDGEPEPVDAAFADPGFFEAFSVAPALGSFYTREPVQEGPEVVILGHGLWQRRFGGDAEVVGRTLTIDGETCTVVAVMPPGFGFPLTAQLWRPLVFDFDVPQSRGAQYLGVVARLADTVSEEEAQAELEVIASRLEQSWEQNRGVGILAVNLQADVTAGSRRTLLVLLGAVALILLIACANVANLNLARATGRRRELAVRSALGAGRRRIIQQLMMESLLIASAGAAAALLLTILLLPALLALLPASPLLAGVRLDSGVLLFTLSVAVASSLLSGLIPAVSSSRHDPQANLAGSRQTTLTPAQNRLRGGLIVAEVAIAVTLVVGAALLLQTFWKLLSVDPGFDPGQTVAMRISLPAASYPEAQARTFYRQLLEGVQALPDVTAGGLVAFLPLGGSWTFSFDIEGRDPFPPGSRPTGAFRPVAGDYFRAMGIPLMQGRLPRETDTAESAAVVVVNETLARRFFPDGNALGGRLLIGYGSGEIVPREIVGVVRDIKQWGLSAPAPAGFYLPHSQIPFRQMYVVVRTAAAQERLLPLLKQQVWNLDADLAISAIESLQERLDRSVGAQRSRMWLVGVFAVLALVLALVGVYGLIACAVHQRLAEVGLRMAIGASGGDILLLFLRSGVTLVGCGILLGLAASLGLTRVLEALLFETSPTDPATLAVVAALVAVTALAAGYLPARRALRVDPVRMLRTE